MIRQQKDAAMTAKSWDKHTIIAEVHRRGSSLRAISRAAGLTHTACSCALAGRRWPKAEKALAHFLGVPVSLLFPDRYRASTLGRQHNRKSRMRKVKSQQRTLTARDAALTARREAA